MKSNHSQPELKSANINLNDAFKIKKDEFYTLYEDVEKEMLNYTSKFKGKTVICNCDDPFESAFFHFFLIHFKSLGLVRLISTCYAGSSLSGTKYAIQRRKLAYKAVVTNIPNNIVKSDGIIDFKLLFSKSNNLFVPLKGDGDFRSDECKALLKQADIVVTNPPFSLFREFIALLYDYKKKFIILGNMNASTTKQIFPLFSDNKVRYGESIRSGDRKFYVPDDYPLKASGCGVDDNGRRFIKVKGVRWFTNIKNSKEQPSLVLIRKYNKNKYPFYENYNAIEVPRTRDIPSNFKGIMGVPITFLDKYNPKQFRIIMLANGNARTNVSKDVLSEVSYQKHPEDRGGVAIINGKRAYARILIQRRSI
tara:strand:- start:6698 stop:7792 length:1095 start_codon:yes stop_codon:yes gene_type:complete